jgi:hypothetical protein
MALNSKAKAALVFAAFIVVPLAAGSAALLTWLRPIDASGMAGGHVARTPGVVHVPEAAPWLPVDPSAAVRPQGLARLKGGSPWGLVQTTQIGAEIQGLVPLELAWCLKDAFANYLPSLTLGSDGSLISSRDESNADRGVSAFVMVTQGDAISIVLQCDPDVTQGESGKTYQFFTNDGARAVPAKPVLDWLRTVGRPEDVVLKSDGKETITMTFEAFMRPPGMPAALAPKPKAAPIATADPLKPYIGEWDCLAPDSGTPEVAYSFRFALDGGFAYSTDRADNRGTYHVDGAQAEIQVTRVWLDGKKSFPADVSEALTFAEAPRGQLKFGMTRGAAGVIVQYECATKGEYSATTD